MTHAGKIAVRVVVSGLVLWIGHDGSAQVLNGDEVLCAFDSDVRSGRAVPLYDCDELSKNKTGENQHFVAIVPSACLVIQTDTNDILFAKREVSEGAPRFGTCPARGPPSAQS